MKEFFLNLMRCTVSFIMGIVVYYVYVNYHTYTFYITCIGIFFIFLISFSFMGKKI